MNKNDKLIIAVGVIIILVASIGVYTWRPSATIQQTIGFENLMTLSGMPKDAPKAIVVSDANPFLPLIATPVALHYSAQGEQEILPLYIQNMTNPSSAVTQTIQQIDIPITKYIDCSQSVTEWSRELAQEYWLQSNAALLIKNNEQGYYLGLAATPLASYLSIPIFVIDDLDTETRKILTDLKVETTLICGDNITGYGNVLHFSSIDEIVNATIYLLNNKFGGIDYITIANPKDAWPPEVLASEQHTFGPITLKTQASTQLMSILSGADGTVGTFTIPDDYKYALVKIKGMNLEVENVDELGDNVIFNCGPMLDDLPVGLQNFELVAGGTGGGGIPVRDANGNIIEDILYTEGVVYDRGGVDFKISATGNWLATKQGDVKVEVTVEKLANPLYPLMKQLSTIAPYLTAYHQGLLFAHPEFAFAADDHTLYMGEPCPGYYQPRGNPTLTGASNHHVFLIHNQINRLLAQLAGISIEKDELDPNLKELRSHYALDPVYISLVGGAVVLPQYIYDSPIDPIFPPDAVAYYFGGGVPSDFIYGNIDPKPWDWSSQAPDLYTPYPFQENIVGRITGWDSQDASALIARTIYYDDIIETLGDWKNTAVVQLGGGNDFQKPLIRYKIFGEILQLIRRGEPMKLETGASYINGLALQKNLEDLGFTTEYLRENEATYQGFSTEAIDKLKQANLLNKVLLSKRQIGNALGEDIVRGGETQEASNFILANAHGNQHMFGMGDVSMYKLGLGLPNGLLPRFLEQLATIIGFGPGMSLSDHGYYNTRNVENMDLGPCFMFIESCICGKIDGVPPQQIITQAYLHAGANVVISSTTSSNIAGGYIEPKNSKYDLPGQTLIRFLRANRNVKKGVYPELHFGFKIYTDLCNELTRDDEVSIGFAYREARNKYLPEDADWKVWWSPPLVVTGIPSVDRQLFQQMSSAAEPQGLDERLDNKFMSFFEYTIYGDPAFVPYVPINN